jgi:hypothetical protein
VARRKGWYIAPRKAQGSSDPYISDKWSDPSSEDVVMPWSAQQKPRAAKCQAVYDKAAKLQKDSRTGDMPSCRDAEIAKAVLQAFAGPCGKAEKQYRKALKSCKKLW